MMARILVVEDDDSVRHFTARALAAAGHDVETAADGDEGLARIERSGASHDLIVSDIRMPVMDGIEMAQRAASSHPGIKILLMTGYAEQRERAAELAGTVIDVVQKPFSLAEIRESVNTALSKAA